MSPATPERVRVGLLPLYLALYDRALPEYRAKLVPFVDEVRRGLEQQGLDVTATGVCTVRAEFEAAIGTLETQKVDLLITLHLAYSPSGESAERLARSPLPVLMLDSTPQLDFGPCTDPQGIMANHGIHGLQDLASVLRRMGKKYAIEAGHLKESDVLARAASWARAAAAARRWRTARVGRVGSAFIGMHDFAVEESVLQSRLGPVVVNASPADVAREVPAAESAEVAQELASDRERFDVSRLDSATHIASIRAGLALRRFVAQQKLSAVTMNFESFTAECGMPTVPFLEASKSMARGVGYAGENDVLTASLTGALAATYRDVTFTEMFCPDWKGGSVFLSHMGEINIAMAAQKPLLVANPYKWARISPPVIAACTIRPGPAVFVNIVPGPKDSFSLILAPVEVLPEPANSQYLTKIRAWIKSPLSLEKFLAAYSYAGGTHHAALVLGNRADELTKLACLMNVEPVRIG